MSDEVKNDIAQKIKRFYLTGLAICLLTLVIMLFSRFSNYSPPYYIIMPYSNIILYGGLIIIFVGIFLVLRKVSWCYPSFLMKVPEFSLETKMKSCLAGITLMLIGVAFIETVGIANERRMILIEMFNIYQIGFIVMTKNELEKELSNSGSQNKEDSRK